MNAAEEAQYVHEEIDRAVLLLRSEKMEVERQRQLNIINRLTIDFHRLYDEKK